MKASAQSPVGPPTSWSLLVYHSEFRTLFISGAISKVGINIGYVSIPLVAILGLDATEAQVGALAAMATAATLIVGLPAGAWLDRKRCRPVLVAAEFSRAALLLSVPLAWWLDWLTLIQLYAVVFGVGTCRMLFDVGQQSILPLAVSRSALTPANSAIVAVDSVTIIGGRGVAGFLVHAVTAPIAVALEAVMYFVSGLVASQVRITEPPNEPAAARIFADIREGTKHVFGHPVLRALLLAGALNNVGMHIVLVMFPFVIVRDLGQPAYWMGILMSVGGVGAFIGAVVAKPLGDHLGPGRTLWLVGAITSPFALAIPFIDVGIMAWLATRCWMLVCANTGVSNVLAVSVRQQATPDRLLGRMNATFRFIIFGVMPIGAVTAGVVGEIYSAHAALWIGAMAMATQWLILFLSPLRRVLTLCDLEKNSGHFK